ncbi:MAG TPA: glycogen/starch/alpha-glucan phosphorylase [Polyangiaceae bacterium]|jgi:starch phosphorylase|nr:MAG: Maltodextrin phosphorylase [Deltaproteobacteria bacterium ADurb.Bin207]HNZ21640.1 glycogen/starch/alpha-glucan phosphorylase [Polyangiaceae bacterium]HOD25072.1 glycogen/starch/alpha-glucan phosphorylase [Polyangiaceae bacterium]HOE48597.1 glycogen/starch/alpha-glucan phosphorylase [Polyangiaceae bacterium]HOH01990.1 glycogen/starch/alpha-glucan phosphorylase [Polyangiaceae bacterium]
MTYPFHISDDVAGMRKAIENHLKCTLARDARTATRQDWYLATAHAVRDRIMERYIVTMQTHANANTRRVYYLSLEYLMGRMLHNNLYNTGLFETARKALAELGLAMPEIDEEEPDMGLGNGGLGRLAACFLDSLATLDLPAVGYGIFYEFGLFRQRFVNGHQTEYPDSWLQVPSPWFVMRPEYAIEVKLYGHVEHTVDDRGDFTIRWVGTRTVLGIPHDLPICGYGARTVNFLRLWESRASEEFDLTIFNEGGYVEAVREKAVGETFTKVLYPNDKSESGKELRLVQQYFIVACSLRDIVRRYFRENEGWDQFADKVAIQLNDTHPAIAVPELMRILVDEERMGWQQAWGICQRVFSYTNHTLLPEALERWSVPLMAKVLPRHLQIIYEINRRFLEEVEAKWPGDGGKRMALSLIEEGEPKHIRMAYLSVIASHTINGVAALHTQLLRERLFSNFSEMYPERFQNKTNGITPRRWLKQCNPRLSKLIDDTLGHDAWPVDLDRLRPLQDHANDPEFQKAFMAVKHANKIDLTEEIKASCGLVVDPNAIFDVQVKRLHEYKRQHLNLLYILTLYRRLLHDPDLPINKRVFIFGAKAAPGYDLAKRIIRAINAVAAKINDDPRIQDKIKIAFLPNYSVSLAEKIIPATDVSQQISTAGKEASGTGNMKLALNGAVTIGTLDGANVEILEEVGSDNIFIFGNTVQQIDELRRSGYDARLIYQRNPELKAVLDWLHSDVFAPAGELSPVVDSILVHGDPFFVAADYEAYCQTQDEVDKAYRDKARWARMAITNTARVGKFSSDRTIREYARDIWNLEPVFPPEQPLVKAAQ